MAKIVGSFEDWTPPWGDGEIDADAIAKLIYNLQKSEQDLKADNKTLKASVEELTEANDVFKAASDEAAKEHDSATQKAVAEAVAAAEKRAEQAEDRATKAERKNDLLEVRVKFPKIDEDDIERLRGDKLEDLLEDAQAFAEKHGLLESENDDKEDGDENEENHLQRQPRVVRTPGDPEPSKGSGVSMDKFLESRAKRMTW